MRTNECVNKISDGKIQFLIIKKINIMLESGSLDKAESLVKNTLRGKSITNYIRSMLYYFLGEINYHKDIIQLAKRYFKLSLKYYPDNEKTLYEISNLLIDEFEIKRAKKYIEKNLSKHKNNKEYKRQYAWCHILEGNNNIAIAIYKKLISDQKIDPESFVELSLGYLYNIDLEQAKKCILAALSKFPENEVVEEAFNEIVATEKNLKINNKEIFFKRLEELVYNRRTYSRALKEIVISMTVRGYFSFEIEKAADLLVSFNKRKIAFRKYQIPATICELIISEQLGVNYILNLLSYYYSVQPGTIKRWYDHINSVAGDEIKDILDQLLDVYDEEFPV